MIKSDVVKPTTITIKFDERAEQTVGDITKISGFVRARHLIAVIDQLDLEANPRSARVGRVTNAIIDSIVTTPKEFPFKTKGILLGATEYELLDRGRVRASFKERDKEGILDGGHNTLAIGIHILRIAGVPESKIKKARDWVSFRALWSEAEPEVKHFRGGLAAFGAQEPEDDDLAFRVPVELIVPRDPEDQVVVGDFQSSILEICAARNNNAELVVSAKSNQAGFYNELKTILPTPISQRIEWKTGEGGSVKVADLIALAWMPLSLLDPMPTDEGEKPVVPPIPQNLYRSKGECLAKFDELMRLDAVTVDHDGKAELRNPRVLAALKVAASLPEVWDLIEEQFPGLYNSAGGSYGRIVAVKKLNATASPKHSKFEGRVIPTASPDGFLWPLVFGVRALLRQQGDGSITWVTDPIEFLKAHLSEIVVAYMAVMQAFAWDPQNVGKAPLAYQHVTSAVEGVLRAELGTRQ